MRTHSPRIALVATAIAVVLALGVSAAHAQNKCLAGKTKCVNKRVAGLLKCQEKCQKNPFQCGEVETACKERVITKYNGASDPDSCFGKLEAQNNGPCVTFNDRAAMGDKVDTFVVELRAGLESSPTVTPTPAPRFVDNGDGTVTDGQTGLQWEKKTTAVGSGQNFADPHDVDNTYTWNSNNSLPYPPDATVFTDFLATLNGGVTGVGNCTSEDGTTITGGFAGHCDWRLPTIVELQTILLASCPAYPTPCIDPIFGPTSPFSYWSSTTLALNPDIVWYVFFGNGYVNTIHKYGYSIFVRAVRSGL